MGPRCEMFDLSPELLAGLAGLLAVLGGAGVFVLRSILLHRSPPPPPPIVDTITTDTISQSIVDHAYEDLIDATHLAANEIEAALEGGKPEVEIAEIMGRR
jgi:hypothetical protein